jgi:tetratricopeptide (TPR) repeat protein
MFANCLSERLLAVIVIAFLLFPAQLCAQSLSLSQIANSAYQAGQFDSALVMYSRIIAEGPNKKEGYYNRGLCYYKLNRFAQAQSDFTRCLQIDSVFEDAIFIKIITLQKQDDWTGASNEFKRLNTTYTGYKELKKRIQYHLISVSISRNWYYMIAIMFLFIILVAVAAKSYTVRRGY